MPVSEPQVAPISHISAALTSKDPVVVALGLGAPELYAAPCTHPDGSEGWSIPFSYLDVVNAPMLVAAAPLPQPDIAKLANDVADALSALTAGTVTADAVWDKDPDLGGDFVRLTVIVSVERDAYRSCAGGMYDAVAHVLEGYPTLTVAPTILRNG